MPLQVQAHQSSALATTKFPVRRYVLVAIAVLLVGTGVVAVIFARHWPFTQQAVVQALQQQSGGTVKVGNFRETFFPQPGCIAQAVEFRRNSSNASSPFITVQTLTIAGSYIGLMIGRINTIRADGLRISIAPPEEPAAGSAAPWNIGSINSGLAIGQVIADGAELRVSTDHPPGNPLVFRITKLSLSELKDHRPLTFQAMLQIPQPPAEVAVSGKFGPWQTGGAGQTQLSGSYVLRNMDLGVFGGIGGALASQGSFDGVLQHILVQGTTDIPNFGITRSGHSLPLKTEFHATVNGLNGDVAFDPVTAHFGRTTIVCAGTVEGHSNVTGAGKTLTMEAYSDGARVQDLVRLFVREPVAPMTGPIVFRAKVTLPPEDRPFLDKVQLQGDFGITGGKYTNPETQKEVDVLSARAKGKADKVEDIDDKRGDDSYDPGRVLSNVKGHVALHAGVARLTNVSFDVPGASAKVDGTYKLESEKVDFQGQMHLDTQLSKATTGVKSVLLKIVEPLMKSKKEKGSIVSLSVGGTYHHPIYTVLPVAKK